jgi:uncharacterized protein (TIGR00661 family)
MAKIVYGISGEGSGHSSRARVILPHLLAAGHEVKAVSYDRGYRNLKDDFDVFETEGLHIAGADNKVSVVQTFTDNLRRLGPGIQKFRELRRQLFVEFEPDCVLCDFEPMSAYLALHHDVPLASLDNQHRMRYMESPCPAALRKDALITETIIRAMVPRPAVSLVTTFFFGETKNERTFLFPPILRKEILAAKSERGDHILVYFTQGFESFLRILQSFPRERFIVYGQGERSGGDGSVEYKPPGRETFLEDLRTARGVIASAGFTLMTEALHLAKPYLALPMKGQFEQELNALLLENLLYGLNGRSTSEELVGHFLYRLPELTDALSRYPKQDNSALLNRLDQLLDRDAVELREWSARRSK